MALLRLIRPQQWVKNSLVFVAWLFAEKFLDPEALLTSVFAFISFSFAASSVYIINDLLDVEQDRLHPTKKNRPIASGQISVPAALISSFVLGAVALVIAFLLHPAAGWLLVSYVVVMNLYSLGLKHYHLIDVFIIAGGLVLRAIYGAIALQVAISDWLLICAFLISLMLALVKRRQELARAAHELKQVRRSLRTAPPVAVWDHWINAAGGITVLAYILYTVDPLTVARVGSNHLLYTSPLVIYAIFRYTARVQVNQQGEDPTEALMRDRGMIITVLLWLVSVILIFLNIL